MQVFVGELLLSKSMHRNITNALTAVLHFIVDAISAFFVALVVQTVGHPPLMLFVARPILDLPQH